MSAPSSARVLVVDPYPDSGESLAVLLRLCGHKVHCLHDGRSVLTACRVLRPAAVILELRLPGLDGWQVAQQIRQDQELRDMLLIAWTTCGREHDRIRSRQAGIDFHVLKPGDPELLLALLALPIRSRRAEDAPLSADPFVARAKVAPALVKSRGKTLSSV
jgi:DNA-binding response OmpR family regulator